MSKKKFKHLITDYFILNNNNNNNNNQIDIIKKNEFWEATEIHSNESTLSSNFSDDDDEPVFIKEKEKNLFFHNDDDDFIINNNNNNNNKNQVKKIIKNKKNYIPPPIPPPLENNSDHIKNNVKVGIKRKKKYYTKIQKEEFFKLDGVIQYLQKKVIKFKNRIDSEMQYKEYTQPHMVCDKRFITNEYSQDCHVFTDPCGSKGRALKYKKYKICVGWHALILFLKDGSINSNAFHASHLCNLPGKQGVCLNEDHIKLEPQLVNENRKQCLKRFKQNPFKPWICNCNPKCLGSDR